VYIHAVGNGFCDRLFVHDFEFLGQKGVVMGYFGHFATIFGH
jgi:hypothetical protein